MGSSFSKLPADAQNQVMVLATGGLVLLAAATFLCVLSFGRRSSGKGGQEKSQGGQAASATPTNGGAKKGGKRQKLDLNDPVAFPGGPLAIFFGSQTGTAESFAKVLQKEGRANGFAALVQDLEEFTPEQLQNTRLAIFLLATYGEGDPTDNAMDFAKWSKNEDGSVPPDFLKRTRYAVFGLGNTQYEKYNSMGKESDARLAAMGAKRVLELGLGDDNGCLEEDFEAWKEKMWEAFLKKYHPARGALLSKRSLDESSYYDMGGPEEVPFKLEYGEAPKGRMRTLSEGSVNSSTKYYFHAVEVPITVNRELRSPKDGGSTRHIEVDISGTNLQYITADNLAILPQNPPSVVQKVATSQKYDLNAYFRITGEKPRFPTPCTVEEALTNYIDLTGVPRRSLLTQLAHFAGEKKEVDRLRFLSSKDGMQEFRTLVEHAGRSLADLISEMFPSIQIPLDHLINLASHLTPRYYTISSSSSVHPTSVSATVAVIKDPLPGGRFHDGVCTNYLIRPTTELIRVFIRPSTFRLPPDASTPIIMIGPGTGIAPMRALLQERHYQRVEKKLAVGPTILFFGCRRRDEDFLYEDELLEYSRNGTLTDLQLAFSREQQAKVYVQHLMAKPEMGKRLWEMLDGKGAYVYVCGATTMGTDVHKTVLDIVKTYGRIEESQAQTYVHNLQINGRYVQELWSGA